MRTQPVTFAQTTYIDCYDEQMKKTTLAFEAGKKYDAMITNGLAVIQSIKGEIKFRFSDVLFLPNMPGSKTIYSFIFDKPVTSVAVSFPEKGDRIFAAYNYDFDDILGPISNVTATSAIIEFSEPVTGDIAIIIQ
ncbi:hypothetical protein UFOVP1492_20 [uncultured Caudovirales phage]|uniref:Uncharacterized protein n=1 Tax=uncultured Caudovirales phage TaxID=2100421 RepID=A0A6J5RMV9_9CAUD|nr:hypothetical protein UFOVP1127_114 [uncultured Caudovirales phage]CAB4193525.1 hypothetical protein UFOVP1242_96 [uncultured Caudovirales phage]CAB4217304.1 hypothetical protein UFOVP1492_20 [uncultured Caudovirales phage]CAB5231277.1 hypothetical protein UFOVP1580_49 [uncultured Caudovirales phage]